MIDCPSCTRATLKRSGDGPWLCPACHEEFDPTEVDGGPALRRQTLRLPSARSPWWDSLAKSIDAKNLERVACPECGAPASLEHLVVESGGRRRRRTIRRCWRRRTAHRDACRPAIHSEEDVPA